MGWGAVWRQMTLFAGESDDDNASMRRGRRFRACGDYGEARPVRHASAAMLGAGRKGRMTREADGQTDKQWEQPFAFGR